MGLRGQRPDRQGGREEGMIAGIVTGVIKRKDHTLIVVTGTGDNKGRENIVDVHGVHPIKLGDSIWTQSGYAMWGRRVNDDKIVEEKLVVRRKNWKGEVISHDQ